MEPVEPLREVRDRVQQLPKLSGSLSEEALGATLLLADRVQEEVDAKHLAAFFKRRQRCRKKTLPQL